MGLLVLAFLIRIGLLGLVLEIIFAIISGDSSGSGSSGGSGFGGGSSGGGGSSDDW